GIEVGQEVTPQFDPMLAKLIVTASDRKTALKKMEWALQETVILGLRTNQPYLLHLCKDPKVQLGEMTTRYLESNVAKTLEVSLTSDEEEVLPELLRQTSGNRSQKEVPMTLSP